jgi:hypothetical protein
VRLILFGEFFDFGEGDAYQLPYAGDLETAFGD